MSDIRRDDDYGHDPDYDAPDGDASEERGEPLPNRATRRAAARIAKRTPEVPPEHVSVLGRYG